MMEYRKGLIGMLILANIIVAGYLAYTEVFCVEPFCLTGGGCKIVQNSEYGSILGIKLGVVGIIGFFALFLSYILAYKKKIDYKIYLTMSFIGALGAIYFISLQFFVIKAVCSNCMAVDFNAILIFLISYYDFKKSLRERASR